MKEKNKKFYRNKNKLNNKYKKKKKRIAAMTDLARKLNNLETTLLNANNYAFMALETLSLEFLKFFQARYLNFQNVFNVNDSA